MVVFKIKDAKHVCSRKDPVEREKMIPKRGYLQE